MSTTAYTSVIVQAFGSLLSLILLIFLLFVKRNKSPLLLLYMRFCVNHIGIENVRSRLKIQCGGELKIDSKPGNGTTVTLVIPKEA